MNKGLFRRLGGIFAILAIVFWSSACGLMNQEPISTSYKNTVNSWMGADINNLISSWGPPSNVYEMPNGNKMYTWLWNGGTLITTNYLYYLNQTQSNAVQYWCKTTFTTDTSDKIITWRIEGNACR